MNQVEAIHVRLNWQGWLEMDDQAAERSIALHGLIESALAARYPYPVPVTVTDIFRPEKGRLRSQIHFDMLVDSGQDQEATLRAEGAALDAIVSRIIGEELGGTLQ